MSAPCSRPDPHALTLTARALSSKGSLVMLALCYAVSASYVWFADAGARKGLLVWYAGVALLAAAWYTPVFVAGGRIRRPHSRN